MVLTALMFFALPLSAQHLHQHAEARNESQPHRSNYAPMKTRPIKALSEQQIADLMEGKGMSLALPAELNGYPGPAHTLELAEQLALTSEQRQKTQQLFHEMQVEAKSIGQRLIASEEELDRLFAERRATSETIAGTAEKAARLQGQLRASHLQYHLKMVNILRPSQVAHYNALRGYAD